VITIVQIAQYETWTTWTVIDNAMNRDIYSKRELKKIKHQIDIHVHAHCH